ncbi:MAG: SMP-30/gluconolactonase/LRE family protein [Phenylobacterium sp.]
MTLRCVVQASDRLGEGPVWSPLESRLYWFDIKGFRLSWYAPATDARGNFVLPIRASAAAPRARGGLIVATEKGLANVDPDAGTIEMVVPMDLGEGFRSNEGKIDTLGRFWWSSMDDDGGKRPAAVFITTPNGVTRTALTGIHIPNTLSASPDGSVIYVADSARKTIYAHQMADLKQVREFAHTRDEAASPDGSAVDIDGYLWNAQWGGSRIVRYAPDGSIDRIIQTPVSQPTSCAFGGEDLTTLYVTSAWDELSPGERADEPLAGSLFAFEPGVKGLALPPYEG